MISVSVIIPVYNAAKCLEQCIRSVMNQTLQGIEIICIDDGSSDESLNSIASCRELIHEFLKKAGRSTLVPGSNGLSTVTTSRICSLRFLRTRSSVADVSA